MVQDDGCPPQNSTIDVGVSLVSSIRQTFSHIGYVYLTKVKDSFTHGAFLVVNGPGVVFLLTRSGYTRGALTLPTPG
jgi:hypothetical protein